MIDNVPVRSLLDTGANVSLISSAFYKDKLGHLPLHPLGSLLDVECAGGRTLPYQGYVEAEVRVPGAGNITISCLFLVGPDTRYNQTVPVLLGTNILTPMLERCREQHGPTFLQRANLHTPWYLAYRSLAMCHRALARNQGKLGSVRSVERKRVIIPGNTSLVIRGQVAQGIYHPPVDAMLVPSRSSKSVRSDLDIEPMVIKYSYNNSQDIEVVVANLTTQTIVVPPRAILCELHPVTVQEVPSGKPVELSSIMEQVEIGTEGLSEEQVSTGMDMILRYHDIFSKSSDDLGFTDMVRHRIDLHDNTPFKQRYRRIPPGMYDEVKSHLQELLSADVIRPSCSPWSSNVVLAKRKDGRLRLCLDFRQLNRQTIKDGYALPRIEELLDCLGGNQFFSVLDMKSGYHQVEIEEDHKQRTAFTTGPLGFWEFNRMPFGLSNAPATYQRLMEKCLEGLHLNICLIYLDDVIIFSRSYEEHIDRLEQVFRRLQECGLKLAPKKCHFFKKKVRYVGYIVSADGIEADPDKIDKIKNWPRPVNPEEVRKFLGFAGYYRKFVENFSKIARPLSEIMPRTTTKKNRHHKIDRTEWKWGPEQEESFTRLKTCLTTPPVLGFVDFKKPFELHTDASGHGLGAVLYQECEGRNRVIAYASRGLTKAERNYSAHKLEYLCLKWSVTEKFNDYLYGNTFTVITDNNPLTYVLTTARLDATGHRWLAALSNYNFSIHYRPGKNNQDADALSRLPVADDQGNQEEITRDTIAAICGKVQVCNLVESLSFSPDVATDMYEEVTDDKCLTNAREWSRAQRRDPSLALFMDCLEQGRKPGRTIGVGDSQRTTLNKNFSHLKLRRGVLYRTTTVDGQEVHQLVLPSKCRPAIIKSLHDNVGHPGKERTVSLIRDRFYWPGMIKDVDKHVQTCDRCVRRKTPPVKAPMVSIETSQPLELVCMDFLTLEQSKGGQQYVLVVTDHFTRYAQAFPCKNMTAKTTAELFFNNFVVHYGLPRRIHSDKGANFVGNLMTQLCQLLGIDKSSTTPYHPMGNGMCERFNRTLMNMLGTLDPESKRDWKSHVAPLVHAYNCTRHESTGQSPFFLMFGRHPRLPVDLAFGLETEPNNTRSLLQYTKSIQERLRQAYDLATLSATKSRTRQKQQYDRRARAAVLDIGDRVLVKIVAFDGRHKLSDKWENDPYVVLNQPNASIPVYVVGREKGEGRTRTLHRNLLLPISSLPRQRRPIPKPRKKPGHDNEGKESTVNISQEDSDEETVILQVLSPEPSASSSKADDQLVEVETLDCDRDEATAEVTDSTEDPDHDDSVSAVSADCTIDEAAAECADSTSTAPPDDQDSVDSNSDSFTIEDTVPKIPVPVPAIRRSGRTRKRPGWMDSGEYVLSMNAPPDWRARAEYLSALIAGGIVDQDSDEVHTTLLNLISGK